MRVFKQLGQDAINIQNIIKNINKELLHARESIDSSLLTKKLEHVSDTANTLFEFCMDMEFILMNQESPDNHDFDTLSYLKDEFDVFKYTFFLVDEEVKGSQNMVLQYSVSYLISQLSFLRKEILKDLGKVADEMRQKAA